MRTQKALLLERKSVQQRCILYLSTWPGTLDKFPWTTSAALLTTVAFYYERVFRPPPVAKRAGIQCRHKSKKVIF